MPCTETHMRLSVVASLCLLAACAAPHEPQVAEAQPDVVCFSEAAIGTSFKTRRCMSREAYEKSRDKSQRTLDNVPTQAPSVR